MNLERGFYTILCVMVLMSSNICRAKEDIIVNILNPRQADKFYKEGKYKESSQIYINLFTNKVWEDRQYSIGYNTALALLKAEDYKKSADIFRKLILMEKVPHENTLTGLGIALYNASNIETSLTERIELLRKSAYTFITIARNWNSDSACRNTMIASAKLQEALEEKKTAELYSKYKNITPRRIVNRLLKNQRNLLGLFSNAISNTSPERITLMENVADELAANSDLCIPLLDKLSTLKENHELLQRRQTFTDVINLTEKIKSDMILSYHRIRNLFDNGYELAVSVESDISNLLKQIEAILPAEEIEKNHKEISETQNTKPQLKENRNSSDSLSSDINDSSIQQFYESDKEYTEGEISVLTVQRLLGKIKQREKEYRMEKRKRRGINPQNLPIERDW